MNIPKILQPYSHIINFINSNTQNKVFTNFKDTVDFFSTTLEKYKFRVRRREDTDLNSKVLNIEISSEYGIQYIYYTQTRKFNNGNMMFLYCGKYLYHAKQKKIITSTKLDKLLKLIPISFYEEQLKDYFPRYTLKKLDNVIDKITLRFPDLNEGFLTFEIHLDELMKYSNLFRDLYLDSKGSDKTFKIDTEYEIPISCTKTIIIFLRDMFEKGSTQYLTNVYPTSLTSDEFSNLIKIIDYLGIEFR